LGYQPISTPEGSVEPQKIALNRRAASHGLQDEEEETLTMRPVKSLPPGLGCSKIEEHLEESGDVRSSEVLFLPCEVSRKDSFSVNGAEYCFIDLVLLLGLQ